MECSGNVEIHMRSLWVNVLDEFFLGLLDIVYSFIEQDEIELSTWVQ